MEKHIRKFLALQRALQGIDPEFPLQYAICLAEIALDEGLSLTALAMRTAIPLPTVSRIVGALSARRQKGSPYGLVRVGVSVRERRRKELRLTAHGRAIINGIAGILEA
jgi:DNA-binding MarR family transcriptional regulator